MGMKVRIYQRPPMYSDIIVIDGYQMPSPIKVWAYKADGSDIAEGELGTELIPNAYLPACTVK